MREVSYDGFILGHTQTNQLDFDLDLKGLHYTQLRARDYGPGHLYYNTFDRANNSDGTTKFPLRFSERGRIRIDDAEAAQCAWTIGGAPYPDVLTADEVSAKPVGVRDADILVRSARPHGALHVRSCEDLRIDFSSDMRGGGQTLAITAATVGGSPSQIAVVAHGLRMGDGVRGYVPALPGITTLLNRVFWLVAVDSGGSNLGVYDLGTGNPVAFAGTAYSGTGLSVTLNFGSLSAMGVLGAQPDRTVGSQTVSEAFTDGNDVRHTAGPADYALALVNRRLDVRGRARLANAQGLRWFDANGQAGTSTVLSPDDGISVSRSDQTVDCRFELDYELWAANLSTGTNLLEAQRCALDVRLRCQDPPALGLGKGVLELRYGAQANRVRLRTFGIDQPRVILSNGYSGLGGGPNDLRAMGLVDGNAVEWAREDRIDVGADPAQRFGDATFMPTKLLLNNITFFGPLVQFIVNSSTPHPLSTGARVYVKGAGGTGSNADGWWNVTRLSSTAFTLDGSTFNNSTPYTFPASATRVQPVATMGDNAFAVDGAYVWATNGSAWNDASVPVGSPTEYSWLFRLPGPGVWLVSVTATNSVVSVAGTWIVSTVGAQPNPFKLLDASALPLGAFTSLDLRPSTALSVGSSIPAASVRDPRDLAVSIVASSRQTVNLAASAVRMQPAR